MAQPRILITQDGSPTVIGTEETETYHSIHGAARECRHVFIDAGFRYYCLELAPGNAPVRLFELGFGTGLNALFTLLEAEAVGRQVLYYTVELYPLPAAVFADESFRRLPRYEQLLAMHLAPWNTDVALTPSFTLHKIRANVLDLEIPGNIGVIYQDAFSADTRPEQWSEALFSRFFTAADHPGVLTTYAAKGAVRRALQTVGYRVERLPGPPGKREMLRAVT